MANESTTVTFRLPISEYHVLEQAAAAAGESISEFVRKAVMLRGRGGYPIRILPNTSAYAPYTRAEIAMPTPAPSNEAERVVMLEEYVRAV
jgi:mobilization protein NikA